MATRKWELSAILSEPCLDWNLLAVFIFCSMPDLSNYHSDVTRLAEWMYQSPVIRALICSLSCSACCKLIRAPLINGQSIANVKYVGFFLSFLVGSIPFICFIHFLHMNKLFKCQIPRHYQNSITPLFASIYDVIMFYYCSTVYTITIA